MSKDSISELVKEYMEGKEAELLQKMYKNYNLPDTEINDKLARSFFAKVRKDIVKEIREQRNHV